MVAYDLREPLEFVGFRTILSGLRVLKARKKDEANPNIKAFANGTTIGAKGSTYTELKVFNGTINGSSLRSLMAELRHKKLWVNRDGYCYMRIPGSKSTRPPQPTKFIRLNDLFAWEDYVDVPSGETFNPTPSTTIWNRLDSSTADKKVDYDQLDVDLKQAEDDKKKAEDDKNKAEIDKKKAEDDKKKAEDDKKKAEIDKKKAEDDKKKAEDDKKKAEIDKKKAEDDKKKAEDDKKKAEIDKKKAENDKKKAEDDKKKAEIDKKRAEDDKKKAEDDKKKAEKGIKDAKASYEDKLDKAITKYDHKLIKISIEYEENLKKVRKENEDKLMKVNSDYAELGSRIRRMKTLWDDAAAMGCLPLHSWAFQISKTPKPRQDVIFSRTWMGNNNNGPFLTIPPGTLSDTDKTIRPQSLVIYNSNEYFEQHFWWVAKMYFLNSPAYNYLVAFSCNGTLDKSFDREVFADKLTCGTHKFPGVTWDVDTIVIRPL